VSSAEFKNPLPLFEDRGVKDFTLDSDAID